MSLQKVATREDLKRFQLLEVSVENVKVVLCEHDGAIKAFQGDCPHQGASLADGHIVNGHIVCPLHQRHFSCQTGKHNTSDQCLKSYPVTEKDGGIYIDTSELGAQTGAKKTIGKLITIDDLPSPKGNFMVGHLLQFKAPDTHRVLERWSKEQGNLFQINFAGKKILVSTDYEINRQILKSRPHSFRRFSKIAEVLEEMGILGTFNAEGATWEKHRRVTAEALNLRNVKNYFPTIALITERLLKRWKSFAAKNLEVDVQKELMRYTVDITTSIAFGYDTNTLEKDHDIIQNHLEKIFPMINKRLTTPLPIWRYIKFKNDRELDRALVEIKKVIDQFIALAKKRLDEQPSLKQDPTNFLEALLVEQEKDGRFNDREVFGNVLTILLAGEDTTSNSVSWILYYLSQNPAWVQKIRTEANEVYDDKDFPDDYAQIANLKNAEAVAQEVIRLRSVTPQQYMEAIEDVVINNLSIRKGTVLMLQTQMAQTSASHFGEPEKFAPERWSVGKCPFGGAFKSEAIQTFGNGPRFCPGKNLAMVEMIAATSMICKNFDLELTVQPEEVREIFSFTMYPDNLKLRLKPVKKLQAVNI